MIIKETHLIPGFGNRIMLADLRLVPAESMRGWLVFMHGYKGFKDWGAWNQMADYLAKSGFSIIKFNFSHNGTTAENPIEFSDKAAFAANNYSIELDDALKVIDWSLAYKKQFTPGVDVPFSLIGHSRGGGIAFLAAAEHQSVKCVVTLAAVSDFFDRFPMGKALDDWERNGVFEVLNTRTGEYLPHSFQWYEDYLTNEQRLNIRSAVRRHSVPSLILHTADDPAVHPSEAFKLARWNPLSELRVLVSGGHTFGAKHPWTQPDLPHELQFACDLIIEFLQ